MLTSSGTSSRDTIALHAIAFGANSSPAPISAPMRPCVVDTGSRSAVATTTQAITPHSAAASNGIVGGRVIAPPVNTLSMLLASPAASSEPASVVTAPHRIAVR